MFLVKHSPLIGYHGNNELSTRKLLIFKDDLYNDLRSRKVLWRLAELFLRYLAKTLEGLQAQIGLIFNRRQGFPSGGPPIKTLSPSIKALSPTKISRKQ